MYEYFLILKGTNKDLATTEFENLWKTYFNEKIKIKQIYNTIHKFKSLKLINKKEEILKRLTLTNFLGIQKFKGNFEQFEKYIETENIEPLENKTFSVVTKNLEKELKPEIENKKLAKPIWDKLKTPKVKLENPNFKFYFFFKNNKEFFFCETLLENEKEYLNRMPKLRPVVMPYTLKSDMARVAVNLLELKKGKILDPFCGIGGILLEAQDMNFDVIGNDISWNDLHRLRKNFNHYYPNKKFEITLADSQTQFLKKNTIDGIVTDIPYGRASKKLGENLYENFLKSSKIYLKPNKKMVVIYANFAPFKELAKKHFKIVKEIEQYINKSMTRYILILENNK